MRYIIVFAAYSFVAFLLGLAFLFPNRPVDIGDFSILILLFIPILAVFDLVGQTIIDSEKVTAIGVAAKPVLGLVALCVFLAVAYLLVKLVAPLSVPWVS